MRHNEAGRLAKLLLKRIKRNERRHKRQCLMSKEERIEELERKQWRKRMLNGFLVEEADESDNDSIVQSKENGFRNAYANRLPLDSTGQSYLEILPGRKRLIRIISIEFRDLTNRERTDVVRMTQIYNEIHNE